MQVGPLTRKRVSEKSYAKHKNKMSKTVECNFCMFTEKSTQVVDSSTSFWIIENIFAYDMWDGCGVTDHLMIVPKRHVQSLAGLDAIELQEYAQQLALFESDGYSIYARAPENITKSVSHQHTHLIQLNNKRKKILFYARKPHLMWSF